jgi:hypothetical protein
MKESPGRLPWGFKVMRKYLRRSPKQPDDIQNRELRNKKWLRRTAIGFRYRPFPCSVPSRLGSSRRVSQPKPPKSGRTPPTVPAARLTGSNAPAVKREEEEEWGK